MTARWLTALILLLIFAGSNPLDAQRMGRAKQRLQEHRTEMWPPEKTYPRVSLGRALQDVFKRHFEYCGFTSGSGTRDYAPADISRFIGKRELRSKVEVADINGNSLLSYIFRADEAEMPLNVVRYQADQILSLQQAGGQFVLNPENHFDAFVLTKNCSGYLKAALDAGIEPPYSTFRAALDVDDRKESTVVALSGSFVSPLRMILNANDVRTTELMMELWLFYKDHPEFIGEAYFLESFEGVIIRHITNAESTSSVEREIGLNVNGPFSSRFQASFAATETGSTVFSGTDWETIIYADFAENYTRDQLFAPLPSPTEISAYFAQLRPVLQKQRDFPLMTEGAEHRHYLTLEGLPASLARSPWILEELRDGVYQNPPRLDYTDYQNEEGFGGRFTITGEPHADLFAGPLTDRPGKVPIQYQIRNQQAVGGQYLSFSVVDELPTSAHPILRFDEGKFDLSLKEDRRFAFQWQLVLEVEDVENPIDFSEVPLVSNVQVRRADQKSVDVEVADVQVNGQKKEITVILETYTTWPLDRIDDQRMVNYNLSMDVHLSSQRSTNRTVRPIKSNLTFPSLRPDVPPTPALPILTPQPKSGE